MNFTTLFFGIFLTLLMSCSSSKINKRTPSASEQGTIQHAGKVPCGIQGLLEDRIKDCAEQSASLTGNAVLVTRTILGDEVYKDSASGIHWGDTLPVSMNYYEAVKACHNKLSEVGTIKELVWRLPSAYEFNEARSNDVLSVLPDADNCFWTSTLGDRGDPIVVCHDSKQMTEEELSRRKKFLVRCVGH